MARRPRGVVAVVSELFLNNKTTLTTKHAPRTTKQWYTSEAELGSTGFRHRRLHAPVTRFDSLQQATMFLCVGRLDALEFPAHPKLAAYERHARYLMYHDFGTEEGVSGQQLAQARRPGVGVDGGPISLTLTLLEFPASGLLR